MIRVVLDTNVLVSAVISPDGPNAAIFKSVIAEEVRVYLTEDVLAEYHRVFDYDHLKKLDRLRIARLRGLLETASIKVKPGGTAEDFQGRGRQSHLRMCSRRQSRLHRDGEHETPR